jgi:2-(1,2-epoxy-1,2-dihydrophenyl)acetyl-CoA isomerase
MSDDLRLDVEGATARITFTRPDLGNAVTRGQAVALRSTLDALVGDEQVRVVVLTGSGSTFNVGAVSPARREGPPPADPVAAYREQVPVMQHVVTTLAESDLVSIAAINGGCAGAGLALALACDLRWAAATATFNAAFLSVGLSGELGAAWFATRLAGAAAARRLLLTPGRTTAETMAARGLVDEVVPADELDAAVTALAQQLAAAPRTALAGTKATLRQATELPLADHLRAETETMLACIAAQPPNMDQERTR